MKLTLNRTEELTGFFKKSSVYYLHVNLEATPEEMLVLRDALRGHHERLVPKLWQKVDSAEVGDPHVRVGGTTSVGVDQVGGERRDLVDIAKPTAGNTRTLTWLCSCCFLGH